MWLTMFIKDEMKGDENNNLNKGKKEVGGRTLQQNKANLKQQ